MEVGKPTKESSEMSIGAINNPTAFSVYTNYATSSSSLEKSMARMSTGIKSVVDDSAGVAISERMRSEARSTAMARNNVENGISFLQTADGWLQRINDMLARMHELAVEANDGTKTNTDRDNIQQEFSQLQSEIGRIGDQAAKFNDTMLFDTTYAAGKETQVGASEGQTLSISLANLLSSSGVDVNNGVGTSVAWSQILDANSTLVTSGHATSAIANLHSAINFIAQTRASIGGQQSRMEHTRAGLLSYEDNLRAAESKIRDVDMAHESAEMTKYQILSQIGNAMLAQANQLGQGVLQLIG